MTIFVVQVRFRSGLTGRDFIPVHDRGRVLADTAVMIADGGRVLSDLAVLRDQGELFGPVASDPTLWRTLNAVDALTPSVGVSCGQSTAYQAG